MTPLFRPVFHVEECLAQVRECLEKGWTGIGYKTIEFEEAWKEYTKLPYAHFLNSATAGLHLASNILNPGFFGNGPVFSTPITFISTNMVTLYKSKTPKFVDVDEYGCMDPKSLRDAIRKNKIHFYEKYNITYDSGIVFYVGLGGNTGRLKEIQDICKEFNLKLILDASHMAGTYFNGKHVGSEADATIFSFQAVKNLPAGDAGMVCFKDEADDKKARQLSWLGIDKDTYSRAKEQNYSWTYEVNEIGYKYHGNSITAGIALAELPYLEEGNAYRREIASIYLDKLERIAVPMAPFCIPSRHLFQIRVKNREKMISALNEKGFQCGVHYRNNMDYKIFQTQREYECPNAIEFSSEVLSLPCHLQVTYEEAREIAKTVLENL